MCSQKGMLGAQHDEAFTRAGGEGARVSVSPRANVRSNLFAGYGVRTLEDC
jgi:hypothetical protein